MFASKRSTTLTFHYALGEGRARERVTLTPGLVGTGEVLQAMRVIDRAVGGGRPEMTKLCDAIASEARSEQRNSNRCRSQINLQSRSFRSPT